MKKFLPYLIAFAVAGTAVSCAGVGGWTGCSGMTVNLADESGMMNWSEANTTCNNKKTGDDWRLPTRTELECMCENRGAGGYATDGHYWSSTADSSYYYYVYFNSDGSCVTNSLDPSNIYRVRCVQSR